MSIPGLVGALVTLTMLNVSPVMPLLRTELDLSNFQVSLVLAATILTHAVVQVPGGSLIDVWGSRRSLLLALGLVTVSTLAASLSTSFPLLLGARALLGVGTGLSIICGLVLARELSSPARARIGQGVYGAMLNVGTLLALVSAPIGISMGWRFTFVVEGAFVAGLLALCALVLPSSTRSRHAALTPWREVLTNRGLYSLAAAQAATYSLFVALAAWAPSFIQHQYSIELGGAGMLSGWLTVSAIAFRGAGGLVPVSHHRPVILGSTLATAVLTFLLPLAPSPPVAAAILFLLGAAASLPFGAIFSMTSVLCGPTAVGRGSGLVSGMSNVGAMLFPPLVGYLVDRTGGYLLGFWAVAAAGLLCTAAAASYLAKPASRGHSVTN
ncbi:MAG: MFS transporter [Chloroflexi bacterium]|nr:MFS transporter [Chloroflexota bacterium]